MARPPIPVPSLRRRRVLFAAAVVAALAAVALAGATAVPAAAASGDLVWVRGVELSLQREDFADLAKGPGGTVYAVGVSKGTQGSGDILVVKFAASGKRLWKRTFAGASGGIDWGTAIAVDRYGNAVVTGASLKTGQGMDAVTLKYRGSDGKRLWLRRYNGEANDWDSATAVALDSSGNAYVAVSATVMGGKNVVVLKYTKGGSKAWETMWAGPTGDDDAVAIALDAKRNVYVGATSQGFSMLTDVVTLKLTASGKVAWHKFLDGYGSQDQAVGLVVRGGGVSVAGTSSGPNARDVLAARYDLAGHRLWRRLVKDPTDETATGLDVDGYGNVDVSFERTGANPNDSVGGLVSWSKGGATRWVRRYDTSAGSPGAGFKAVAADASGAAYCAGYVRRGGNIDLLLVKYRLNGSRAWVQAFNSDPYVYAIANSVLVVGGTNGGVYVGGRIDIGDDDSALLLKYKR